MPSGVYERKKNPVEKRFWSKINKDTESGCYEWKGNLDKNEYGRFKVNYKDVRAHRFSYELHHGEIPEGMLVLHSCDNPKCVNPNHLSIGTHKENMLDRNNKNRQYKPKGSLHHNSKLTEEKVLIIKSKLISGEKEVDIAKEFNVSKRTIEHIKSGYSWSHVQN
jgi:hypothetical protein